MGAQGLKPLIPPTWPGCSLNAPKAPAPVRMPPQWGAHSHCSPPSQQTGTGSTPHARWLGTWCVWDIEHMGRAASGRMGTFEVGTGQSAGPGSRCRGLLGPWYQVSQLGPFPPGWASSGSPSQVPWGTPSCPCHCNGVMNTCWDPHPHSHPAPSLALPLPSILLWAPSTLGSSPLSLGSLRPPRVGKVEGVPRMTHALGPRGL